MAEWELSKENIQPLRQGRKVSAMLDPASDAKKIAEEKQWEFSKSAYDSKFKYYLIKLDFYSSILYLNYCSPIYLPTYLVFNTKLHTMYFFVHVSFKSYQAFCKLFYNCFWTIFRLCIFPSKYLNISFLKFLKFTTSLYEKTFTLNFSQYTL